jgi:hypothetical protein
MKELNLGDKKVEQVAILLIKGKQANGLDYIVYFELTTFFIVYST